MVSFSHVIDLDADPDPLINLAKIDPPWSAMTAIRHRRIGRFSWDPSKVKLYLGSVQNSPSGHDVWAKDLVYRHVINANMLDYLLVYQEIIPEDWKQYEIFFWGTIYQGGPSSSNLEVRHLLWCQNKWGWRRRQLESFWWGAFRRAAILDF